MAIRWMTSWPGRKQNFLPIRVIDAKATGRARQGRYLRTSWLVLLLGVSSGGQGRSQNENKQQVPTFRTQSNVVFVPTLVEDQAGKLVFGLKDSDFIIEDDGVPQEVKMDEAEPEEAVSLVIAIQSGRARCLNFSG